MLLTRIGMMGFKLNLVVAPFEKSTNHVIIQSYNHICVLILSLILW